MPSYSFQLNGEKVTVEVEKGVRLLWVLLLTKKAHKEQTPNTLPRPARPPPPTTPPRVQTLSLSSHPPTHPLAHPPGSRTCTAAARAA